MNKLSIAFLGLLAGCAVHQTEFPSTPAVPLQTTASAWELEMKKQGEEYEASNKFRRAYMECQEYGFGLAGCAVIQKHHDALDAKAKIDGEYQARKEKEAAEDLVATEVKELSDGK